MASWGLLSKTVEAPEVHVIVRVSSSNEGRFPGGPASLRSAASRRLTAGGAKG